jgi:hypothetical protein
MTINNQSICYLGARVLTCALLLGLTTAAAAPPKLAFKGAEGAGRFAAGGRGGKVIRVTNLNDSGKGSLRAAVEAKYPRIVKFDVAGTIHLQSPLVIRHPRITITGKGAPAGGIALADNGLTVAADDVVIRYIRSRLGDISRVEADAISIASGRRIILDHVSASWSVDETLSVSARYNDDASGIYDVTVQWSIISESLRKSAHAKGDHGYGSLIRGGRGSRFSFHHNLWAHHVARMPRPGNYTPIADDPVGPIIEFVGNVFYNWGGKAAGYNADTNSAATYAFIDNCYVRGPDSKGAKAFNEENPYARSWFSGNSMDGVVPPDQQSLVTGIWNPLPAPPDPSDIKTQPATLGCASVLLKAGASVSRDPIDDRVVADVQHRTGRIIDSQSEVGGWPDLTKTSK